MIQAESRRTFTHGFVLTEPELRRIVESVTEQFQKIADEHAPPLSVTYTLTYRNGVIADTDSLDDVLSEENSGSGRIVRLRIEFEDRKAGTVFPEADTTVMVEFIDAEVEDEPRSVSVRFLIRGRSRDWVFVTSAILEERVTKIKRFTFNQLGSRSIFLRVAALTTGLVFAFLIFGLIPTYFARNF